MTSQQQIPTFDFAELTAKDPKQDLLIDLATTCHQWGFFRISNHGLQNTFNQTVLNHMQSFFGLSQPEKQSYQKQQDQPWGFYDQELTKNKRDWKEIFDFNLHEANTKPIWPTQQPDFKPTMAHWYGLCEKISQQLTRCLAEALTGDSTMLDRYFAQPNSSFLRLNYYPRFIDQDPLSKKASVNDTDPILGISEHTDAGALTVLAQDEIAGLQVLHANQWQTIQPEKGTLIINVGDMVQVWSNDKFKAPPHRVLTNPNDERYSAAFFYNPSYDSVCRPLNTNEPKYRPVHWGEFRNARAAGDYADKGEESQISHYLTMP